MLAVGIGVNGACIVIAFTSTNTSPLSNVGVITSFSTPVTSTLTTNAFVSELEIELTTTPDENDTKVLLLNPNPDICKLTPVVPSLKVE